MNFQLTEDRLALQQAVREFAEKELAPGVIERDEKSEYPVELYKKMGEMGLIGLPYAKEYGGSGRVPKSRKENFFRKSSPERPLAPSDLPSLTPVPMQAAVLLLQKRKATNTY